ncbi:MAG: nuclear transport factor 2 family protein [Deltaproteobacteria bacterium]|nr:nuclear transport factor 2 family protein [Deltaproteobacteria bacterium]
MSIEENKALARRFMDALSRNDKQFVMNVYADDVALWTAGSLPFSGTHTKDEVAVLMDQILGAFPDGIEFKVKDLTAEGERVAIEAECHAKHMSGKDYNNHYHFLMVIRDGKIIEYKEYMDTQLANDVLLGG